MTLHSSTNEETQTPTLHADSEKVGNALHINVTPNDMELLSAISGAKNTRLIEVVDP